MFCEKCGAQNADGAKFCASCGAALGAETPTYTQQPQQPQPQQPAYNYGYPQPHPVQLYPAKPQGKSTAAIVIFMISGALAVLGLILPFLPHIAALGYGQGESYSMFGVCMELFKGDRLLGTGADVGLYLIGSLLMCLMIIPMILQLIWAILSFVRVKAAGILGLIGSIVFLIHSSIWVIILLAGIEESGGRYVRMTPVPGLMVLLAIAGIVLASLQIAKKDRVK